MDQARISANQSFDCQAQFNRAESSSDKLALEVYDACFKNTQHKIHVPVMNVGEVFPPADGKMPLLAADDPIAKLYMEARRSMGKIRTGDNFVGSGFFLNQDGLFATDFHVVEGSQFLEVTTDNGRVHRARIVAKDPKNDVAILQVSKLMKEETFHPLKTAPYDEKALNKVFVAAGFGNQDDLHVSPGKFDKAVLQKNLKLVEPDPLADPERKLAQLEQHTVRGDSGGIELSLDGKVRLLIGLTDGNKNTVAIPIQRVIELEKRYLKSVHRSSGR